MTLYLILPIQAIAFVLCEFELTLGVTVSAVYFILCYMTGQDRTLHAGTLLWDLTVILLRGVNKL